MSPALSRPLSLLLFVWRLAPSAGHTEERGNEPAAAGDYRQFMDRYAADYAGGSSSSGAPSTDMKADFHDYAKGFDKYMHEADRYEHKFAHQAADYPAKFAGTFEEYVKQYNHQGAQATQSSPVPAQSYEQFLASFAGDMTNLTQAADNYKEKYAGEYKDYKDKFAQDYQDFNFTKEAQDYKDKYAKEYQNDKDKYTKEFQNDKDKYTKEFQNYKDKYTKEFQNYKDKYAKEYSNSASSGPNVPPSEIHNVSELKAWREAALHRIKLYIPKAFRSFPEKDVERTYAENKARIEKEEKAAAAKADANSTHADEPKSAPAAGHDQPKAEPESLAPTILDAAAAVPSKANLEPLPVTEQLDVRQERSSQSLKFVLGMASVGALAAVVTLNVAVAVRSARRSRQEEEVQGYTTLPEP